VCRKSFQLITCEYIKDSIIVGKADIKTDVITEDNEAQKPVWAEYGNCEI
jgi:hypothetical protein